MGADLSRNILQLLALKRIRDVRQNVEPLAASLLGQGAAAPDPIEKPLDIDDADATAGGKRPEMDADIFKDPAFGKTKLLFPKEFRAPYARARLRLGQKDRGFGQRRKGTMWRTAQNHIPCRSIEEGIVVELGG